MSETTAAPKREVEVVQMSDGRTVEFAGKRKMVKDSTIDPEKGSVSVRLDFRNGETRTFFVSDSLMYKFAAHGAEQKLGDEVAGVEDVDDMVIGIDQLIDRLDQGDWSVRRESGNGLAGTSILMKALIEYSGKTKEEIKAFLSGKSQAEKLALRQSAQLKPIVDRLESEKAAKSSKVDTAALLGEL
jgi:hypothetical protein